MRKSHLILFTALLLFWLAMSSVWDFQHVLIGAVLAFFVTWYWRELANYVPSKVWSLSTFWLFGHFVVLLGWEIILANLVVARNIVFNTPSLEPDFVHFNPPIKTEWGRVLLANSITLTPGTVTIDVNPDNGEFMVHGLTQAMRNEVLSNNLISVIQKLETSRGI